MKKSSLSKYYSLLSFVLLAGLFVIPFILPAITKAAPNLFFWSPALAAVAGLICVFLAIREGEPISQLVTAIAMNLFCLCLFAAILFMAYAA
jgi:hypothetical protein